MSDSVKKFYELVEEGKISESKDLERKIRLREDILLEELLLLQKASRSGLLVEVVHTALESMQENSSTTPLLALQIGCYEWDV